MLGKVPSRFALATLTFVILDIAPPVHAQVYVAAWLVTGKVEGWNTGSCSAGVSAPDEGANLTADGLARRFGGTTAQLLVPDVYVAPYEGGFLVDGEPFSLKVIAVPARPPGVGLEMDVDLHAIDVTRKLGEDRVLFADAQNRWVAYSLAAGSDRCLAVRMRLPAPGEVERKPQLGSFTDPATVEGDIEPPRLEKRVDPKYPQRLFHSAKEGRVVIQAVVDETGRVASAQVLRASDPALTMAALDAVIRWRYTPARKAGVPVPAFFTAITTFRKP